MNVLMGFALIAHVIADRRPPTNPSGHFSTSRREDERAAIEVPDLSFAEGEPLADEARRGEPLVGAGPDQQAEPGRYPRVVALERGDRAAGVHDDASDGRAVERERRRR